MGRPICCVSYGRMLSILPTSTSLNGNPILRKTANSRIQRPRKLINLSILARVEGHLSDTRSASLSRIHVPGWQPKVFNSVLMRSQVLLKYSLDGLKV